MPSDKKIIYPEICVIAAMTESGLVGRGDGMPWRSSLDFKWFQQNTMGYPLLFGRRTAIGMTKGPGGFPLKNRPCAVLSRQMTSAALISPKGGAPVFNDLDEACQYYSNFDKIFIAGGPSIYREALTSNKPWIELVDRPLVDTVILTTFPDGYCDGDVYFKQSELMDDSDFFLSGEETFKLNGCQYQPLYTPAKMLKKTDGHILKETDTPFLTVRFEIWRRRER